MDPPFFVQEALLRLGPSADSKILKDLAEDEGRYIGMVGGYGERLSSSGGRG